MDAGIEKECSALGGLFQLIMNDMKVKNKNKIIFISVREHFSSLSLTAFAFYMCKRISLPCIFHSKYFTHFFLFFLFFVLFLLSRLLHFPFHNAIVFLFFLSLSCKKSHTLHTEWYQGSTPQYLNHTQWSRIDENEQVCVTSGGLSWLLPFILGEDFPVLLHICILHFLKHNVHAYVSSTAAAISWVIHLIINLLMG